MTHAFSGAARIIAGRRYVLAFHFNILCELSKTHPEIMGGKLDAARLNDPLEIRAIIHLGLGREVKSEREAGDLITLLRVNGAMAWIGEALAVAFGAQEGEPVNRRPAQSRRCDGTGPKSWLSGLSWAAILMRFGIKRRAHGGPS